MPCPAHSTSSAPSRLLLEVQQCLTEQHRVAQRGAQQRAPGTGRRNTDLDQQSGTRRAPWWMLRETLEQINYFNYFNFFFFLSHDFCASLQFLWASRDFERCVGSKCLPEASASPQGKLWSSLPVLGQPPELGGLNIPPWRGCLVSCLGPAQVPTNRCSLLSPAQRRTHSLSHRSFSCPQRP